MKGRCVCARAIIKLRERNFSKGLPFLILSDELPDDQAYYEFGDGHVEVQRIVEKNGVDETELVRVLSDEEAKRIRENAIR